MSEHNEAKPMTAEQANEIRLYLVQQLPRMPLAEEKSPAGRALDAIGDGRHEVIDKATHAAVPHEELERLRADGAFARWVVAELRMRNHGLTPHWLIDNAPDFGAAQPEPTNGR